MICPFIQDGECAYILEREPAHEAAWLGAVDRNDRLWSANLERTTLAVVGGTPVAYGMWALLDGVASVVTSASTECALSMNFRKSFAGLSGLPVDAKS